eukprot:scaffold252706_cov18-Tisochrysis_lutea.AAC.1
MSSIRHIQVAVVSQAMSGLLHWCGDRHGQAEEACPRLVNILNILLKLPLAEQLQPCFFLRRTLAVAMDHVQKLPVDQRRASDPDTKEVKQRLSALYMHLLPEMDPCRQVACACTSCQTCTLAS